MKRLNSPISVRIARWIRKACHVTLWLGIGCLAISVLSPLGGPAAALAVIIFSAILIDLGALKVGQMLVNREFAAALAAEPLADHRMILYLRSFDIAGRSLGAMFML